MIADFVAEKIEVCFSVFMDKIQPMIRAEVQDACLKSREMEKPANGYSLLDGKSPLSVPPKVDEGASLSDQAPTYASVALEDLRQFPSLSKKKRAREKLAININVSEVNTNIVSGNSNKENKTGLLTSTKSKSKENLVRFGSREQIILMRIIGQCSWDFSAVVLILKKEINLKELGIDTISMRKISCGGMFVINNNNKDAIQKADLLAARMVEVLIKYKNSIVISRPKKNVEVLLSGRNDFISQEEIAGDLRAW